MPLALPLALVGVGASGARVQGVTGNLLMVEVDGLRNHQGKVCLSVFSSDRGFPTQADYALRSECVPITSKGQSQRIPLQGLKPGNYAIAALHDMNDDQAANMNRFGIPTEGFGFSRNPAIRFSAPRFEEAAIAMDGKSKKIKIQLNYLL